MKPKLICALMIMWISSALAADLPELVLPAGMGVNIHFVKGHERDLDLIAAAGFKFIRMDFGWHGIERKKGEYNWSDYDELTANLEKRGIRPLYILDYSNPLYEQPMASTNPISHKATFETASPQHPESIAAFARWAAAAATHYKGRRVIWEIWNEPNIFFWKPKPDVQHYTALALATCKAIREADPNATIIGPASSSFPWEFLEAFLKSGVLNYLDGVSVHPYRSRSKGPETAAADYIRLRELIERCAPNEPKKKLPIISGEWGYSSHSKGVTLETQAAYFARQQLSNPLNGIPLSIWYDWKNDGDDPTENEHNFGTVTFQLEPKPAYRAAQTLARELAGYRIAQRLDVGNTNDFVLVLTNQSGAAKFATWTTSTNSHAIALPRTTRMATGKGVTAIGEPADVLSDGTTVELSPMPKYLAARRR
jgi:polysaccharide biosynthesis protein PslG